MTDKDELKIEVVEDKDSCIDEPLSKEQVNQVEDSNELPPNSPLSEEQVNKDVYLPCDVKETAVFDPPEGFKGYFPPSALAAYGCINCTWRGTNQCPYKFESGEVKKRQHPVWTGLEFPENVKVSGICKYKKNHLILLSGEWEKRPSYDQWQSRLMKNKGVIQNSLDELRYLKIAKELELMENDTATDSKTLNAKKKDYETARANFVQTWHMLEGFFEKGVDRETPKEVKLDIRKTPSMQEIQAAIKKYDAGEAVDADYEVIEDGDDEK